MSNFSCQLISIAKKKIYSDRSILKNFDSTEDLYLGGNNVNYATLI